MQYVFLRILLLMWLLLKIAQSLEFQDGDHISTNLSTCVSLAMLDHFLLQPRACGCQCSSGYAHYGYSSSSQYEAVDQEKAPLLD